MKTDSTPGWKFWTWPRQIRELEARIGKLTEERNSLRKEVDRLNGRTKKFGGFTHQ